MLNPERDHVPRHKGAGKPPQSIRAMAFARIVAAEYQELVSGYRNGLYAFFGRAMVSYLIFLQDPEGDAELRGQDNISGLREKPALRSTSRLVLYHLTGARNDAERNTAGKYARVVDYLCRQFIGTNAAADYVRSAGGMFAILEKARGREAPKVAEHDVDETLPDDDVDSDDRAEATETSTRASAKGTEAPTRASPSKKGTEKDSIRQSMCRLGSPLRHERISGAPQLLWMSCSISNARRSALDLATGFKFPVGWWTHRQSDGSRHHRRRDRCHH